MRHVVQFCAFVFAFQSTVFGFEELRGFAAHAPDADLSAALHTTLEATNHEIIDISDVEWNSLLVGACPSNKQMNVEVILAADHAAAYGADAAYARAISVMLGANADYLQNGSPSFALRLTRIHRFVGTDPFTTSTDITDFLDSVAIWANTNISSPSLGCVIALTGRQFNSGFVEGSYIGTACQQFNAGVVKDRPATCNNIPFLSQMCARATGRILSMPNDGASGFIMSSTLICSTPSTIFSAASLSALDTFIDSASSTCVVTGAGFRKGDMNCDCAVLPIDADLGPFVQSLLDPVGYQNQYPSCPLLNGDMDGDGSVDGGDISLFVRAMMP